MTIALELKQLKKTYPGGVQALKGIDLQVEAGDFYALLGPNGAGNPRLSASLVRWSIKPPVRLTYLVTTEKMW